MKKLAIFTGIVVFCVTALAAQNFKDGIYFAQDAKWAGNQKNQVVIEVKGGKITSVNFNTIGLSAGAKDLKTIAKAADAPAAVKNWATQVAAVEAHIVSSQKTGNATVAGGPANTKDLLALANNAVSARNVQPVAKGSIPKDGWYYAEEADGIEYEYHTRNTVLITVVNGTIVDTLWNGILQGNYGRPQPSKYIVSMGNGYPMSDPPGPGIARVTKDGRWEQQADRVSAELVKVQNPASLKIRADGYTDAISGVSMNIHHFAELAKQALAAAR